MLETKFRLCQKDEKTDYTGIFGLNTDSTSHYRNSSVMLGYRKLGYRKFK